MFKLCGKQRHNNYKFQLIWNTYFILCKIFIKIWWTTSFYFANVGFHYCNTNLLLLQVLRVNSYVFVVESTNAVKASEYI